MIILNLKMLIYAYFFLKFDTHSVNSFLAISGCQSVKKVHNDKYPTFENTLLSLPTFAKILV